jgi:hypothetical protein
MARWTDHFQLASALVANATVVRTAIPSAHAHKQFSRMQQMW